MCMNDSDVSPYLLRACRSYADVMRDSARRLRAHRKTLAGPYRGEQPMSVVQESGRHSGRSRTSGARHKQSCCELSDPEADRQAIALPANRERTSCFVRSYPVGH